MALFAWAPMSLTHLLKVYFAHGVLLNVGVCQLKLRVWLAIMLSSHAC